MLTDNIPKAERQIVVAPEPVQVVVVEDGGQPLAITLPVDDIAEIESLKPLLASIDEEFEKFADERRERFKLELDRQRQKHERFADSPIYLNRLATLAAAAGDRQAEAAFLKQASRLSDDGFFVHRRGDSLVALGRISEAMELFRGLNLTTDSQANLKLAALHVRHSSFELAEQCVEKALEIDPLDYAARLFEGGLALVRQEYGRAIGSFRIAAQEKDNSSALFVNMAIAYAKLGLNSKALSSLKRAVALDPLNANAVLLLADLSHECGLHEEAIPSLRYFVQFQQKVVAIWARLARATLYIGRTEEAVAALKRQATLQDSASVWNNLGVAYCRSGQAQKALSAFLHATTRPAPENGRARLLSMRNLAALLSEQSKAEDVIRFTQTILDGDTDRTFITDDVLSDVYAFHVYGLRRSGQIEEAASLSERLLSQPDIAVPLREWVTGHYLSYLALYEMDKDAVLATLQAIRGWLENANPVDASRRSLLFNNAAFAFAEIGLVAEAERFLARINNTLHREPYPTATLGLIQMRKGHIERAVELYEEAARLAINQHDRLRIRQKLDLELGRYWAPIDSGRAQRLLERVATEKFGELALSRQARRDLAALHS
jgi:tetratricopeptide (TPR) repeat protein